MSTPRLLLLRSAWGLLPLLLFVFSLCHRGCSATTRGLASRSVERDDTDRDRHHSHLVDSVDKRALGTEHHEFIKPKMKTKVQEENGKAPTDMVIAGNKAGAYADEGEPGFRAVEHYPTAEESTVLFLHVFKCAGTSLRSVLIAWAFNEGWSGAVVEECKNIKQTQETRICLNTKNDLFFPQRQLNQISRQKVLAGHFFWGFRRYVRKPYLMITTLRDPLVLFISGQQFMHRAETETLELAVDWVSSAMAHRSRPLASSDTGFLRRFLDAEVFNEYRAIESPTYEQTAQLMAIAINNLKTFWVVGVVDQYPGFLEVLKRCLDPKLKQPGLWTRAHSLRDNGSPVRSREVLDNLDPGVAAAFNSSVLALHWEVYEVALELWDARCREMLPVEQHGDLCSVGR